MSVHSACEVLERRTHLRSRFEARVSLSFCVHLAIDTSMTARFLAHRAISVFPSSGDSQSCGRSFFLTYHEPYETKLGQERRRRRYPRGIARVFFGTIGFRVGSAFCLLVRRPARCYLCALA